MPNLPTERPLIWSGPLLALGLDAVAGTAVAQETGGGASGPLVVDTSVDLTFAGFSSDNTYWGLAGVLLPGFPVDYRWSEGFAKSSIRLDYVLSDRATLYGGAVGVISFTNGEDLVGTVDVAEPSLDGLYIGLKLGDDTQSLDLSLGAQPYSVGTGMLLGDGAPEGSAKGAVTLGPFNSWSETAILRYRNGPWSADAFYLDANEIYEPDTNTTLAGAKLEYGLGEGQFVGLAAGHVIDSSQGFPQALAGGVGVVTIPNGRDGMNFANLYAKWLPDQTAFPGVTLSGDLAYEWNDRIDLRAWGARIRVDKAFENARFRPVLSYNCHIMSGDDPDTAALERFDPLFNSGPDWAAGGNAALILSNSNIQVHEIGLKLALSDRDLLGFKYYHIRSHRAQSPLAVDPSVTTPIGLPNPAGLGTRVADDVSIDYTRIINQDTFFNIGLFYSEPAALLDGLAGQKLDGWASVSATLILKF